MSQDGSQHLTIRFGQLRDALAAMMGIPAPLEDEATEVTKARSALSERLANLKRLHFPPGVNVTKSAKAEYRATAIASLAVAAHLENMHLNPRVVVRALTGSDTQVWRFTAAALSCAADTPTGYRPAGGLLLLFEPSGLDDLGTRAARAGRYDAPASPARIVHFDWTGSTRVHGISVDAAVLGVSLATGLESAGIGPDAIVGDLWQKVAKRRPGSPGGLRGYVADANALLDTLARHTANTVWDGDDILTAVTLLNSMAGAGTDADGFALAVVKPDHPLVTFASTLQAYLTRINIPVIANRPQPASIGLMEVHYALGLSEIEILPWLRRQLATAAQ